MTPHPRDGPSGGASQHGVLLRRRAVTARQRATHHGTAVLRGDPVRPREWRSLRAAAGYQGWGAVQNDTSLLILDYLGLWLERESLSPNRHSLQIWLWGCCPYWATVPSTGPPPSGGPSHLCHWSSGNITYHALLLAGYQPLCVCSQLCASALCF
jgi:hypothetical protein